ncbi:MAG: RtcB family protein [Myxococcota bacterium]
MRPISLEELRPERLGPYCWRIPQTGPMRTDGLVYANDELFAGIRNDPALVQVCNVATLPGIVGPSIAMPDIHWGYGFPIGGVAAFDETDGVISPGGVGFDISCGVRLLRTGLRFDDLEPARSLPKLLDALFSSVPSGVGRGSDLRLRGKDLDGVMTRGAEWAIENGLGERSDLDYVEECGRMPGADPAGVSERARSRGAVQLGTLGSGNHFLELQKVDTVYDAEAAGILGLEKGGVAISIHTGSRGFGYQICQDWVRTMVRAAPRYGIDLPDRQLCCAPLHSEEGQGYIGAMACAVNFALANRQVITHRVREAFEQVYRRGPSWHRIGVVYDVCHNVAKRETHEVDGRRRTVWVHRKGATRAYPPGHPDVPARYRRIGQPVLIPGDMERYSFVLCGTPEAEARAFGSSCHGAGRLMSRKQARRLALGRDIVSEMAARGILVRSEGRATIAEEIPEAYKDVADVVESVEGAGLARKVVRLVPFAVIKG